MSKGQKIFAFIWVPITMLIWVPWRAMSIGLIQSGQLLLICSAVNLIVFLLALSEGVKLRQAAKAFAYHVAIPMIIVNVMYLPQDSRFMAKVKAMAYSDEYWESRPWPCDWASMNYDHDLGFWVME
ncbi:MAG: hypothetical protein H8E15_14460 [Planctomycetes bacterium]|nr:hypothetical protein [Planctomycetota bacterium]